MISVEEAENLISQTLSKSITQCCYLEYAYEEVLRENLLSDNFLPPFHRVSMDGIALVFEKWKEGCRSFPVENFQAAGDPVVCLKNSSHCIEIMTGASLPSNCDTVVPYEHISLQDGKALITDSASVMKMQNIHCKGSDYDRGSVLAKEGQRIQAPLCGIAASIGKETVQVAKRPKIAIISTGNELVPIHHTPSPYQIRRSNPYALQAALKKRGYKNLSLFHFNDLKEELFKNLKLILSEFQVLILSGGVSKGKLDFIPGILKDLHVEKVFHFISQRPGKPFYFGKGNQGQNVFALPGNPVSSLVCLHRYVLPALDSTLGLEKQSQAYAVLQDDVTFNKELTLFQPVKVSYATNGSILAHPVKVNGSGDFASLAKSDGFIELNKNASFFPSGCAHPLFWW